MRTMLGLMFGFGLLAGCSSSEVIVAHNVDLRSADTLVDEADVLRRVGETAERIAERLGADQLVSLRWPLS